MTELNVSEEELRNLVASAKANEPDAWGLLYRRGYRRLFAYARRRLPDQSRTHQAVDETFEHAFNRIRSFRIRKSGFDAWLFEILRSVIFDYQTERKGTWNSEPSESSEESGKAGPPRSDHDPEWARVRSAFRQLAPEEQEVLELRVVGGLASQEVAAILNKGLSSVRSSQSKAADRLGEILDEGGHEKVEADRLFELLNASLLAGVPDAPQEAIAAVRSRAGESRQEAVSGPRGLPLVAALLLFLISFIGGILLGSSPPAVLREGLYRVGMPVESPRMVEARQSIHALAQALGEKDRKQAAAADRKMLKSLRLLDAEEREQLAPLADQIHVRAVELLAQPA